MARRRNIQTGAILHDRTVSRVRLEQLQQNFAAGDAGALLEAVNVCGHAGWPLPKWAAEAYSARYTAWQTYKVKALDAAFHVERKKKRREARERRDRLKARVTYEVLMEHYAKGRSINLNLFQDIGERLGIGDAGAVSDLYYDKDNPYRELGEAMLKRLTNS
jgi:hypothetical protein